MKLVETHRPGKLFQVAFSSTSRPQTSDMSTRPASQTSIPGKLHSDTRESRTYVPCVCLLGCTDQNPQRVRTGVALGESYSDAGFGPNALTRWMCPTFTEQLPQPGFLRRRSCQTNTSVGLDPPATPVHHSTHFTSQKERGWTQTITRPSQGDAFTHRQGKHPP